MTRPTLLRSYLDAIAGDAIKLESQAIPRARLGVHLRLSRLQIEIGDALRAGDVDGVADGLVAYNEAAGYKPSSAPSAIVGAGQLMALNSWQMKIPLIEQTTTGDAPKAPYHLPDHFWLHLVHSLASRYGWTREQIMELWPEEAVLYLQEITVSEYHEYERERALSEVSYEYNKTTKKSTFRKTPMPGWMFTAKERPTVKMKKSWLPIGTVKKLDEQYH